MIWETILKSSEDSNLTNSNVDQLWANYYAAYAELTESFNEGERIFVEGDLLNLAVTQLETAYEVLQEYGLCKPIAKLIDPEGELVKYGVMPATESLSDVPTKDDYARIATERIKDTLKKAWEKIKEFFKKIFGWFTGLFRKAVDATKSAEKIFEDYLEKLKKGNYEWDNDKAKDTEIEVKVPKAIEKEFDKIEKVEELFKNANEYLTGYAKILDKVKGNLEFPEDLKAAIVNALSQQKSEDALGLKNFEIKDDNKIEVEWEEESRITVEVKKRLEELIKGVSDLEKFCENGLKLNKIVKGYEAELKIVKAIEKNISDIISKGMAAKDEKAEREMLKNVKELQKLGSVIFKLYGRAIKLVNLTIKAYAKIVKKGFSCVKEKEE